jgi:hypothetical protein
MNAKEAWDNIQIPEYFDDYNASRELCVSKDV